MQIFSKAFIALALVVATTSSVVAQQPRRASPSPSFSCAGAKRVSEILICRSADLAALDRRQAIVFKATLSRLAPAAAAQLREEQRWFLGLRDALADPGYKFGGQQPRPRVADLLKQRIAYLSSIKRPATRQVISGKWMNYFNTLELRPAGQNAISIEGGGVDPYAARWVCNLEAQIAASRGDKLILEGTDGAEGSDLIFSREGDMMRVIEKLPRDDATTPYCGYRGSFAGLYFSVGE